MTFLWQFTSIINHQNNYVSLKVVNYRYKKTAHWSGFYLLRLSYGIASKSAPSFSITSGIKSSLLTPIAIATELAT